jgi:hypothetical protein
MARRLTVTPVVGILGMLGMLGMLAAPGVAAVSGARVEPGSSLSVTIRQAPADCRAVVELLLEDQVVVERSRLVGQDGQATVTIRVPTSRGRYLLTARLGGPRCPQEGLQQPAQQRIVVVG